MKEKFTNINENFKQRLSDILFINKLKKGNFEIIKDYNGKNINVYRLAIEKGFKLTPEMLEERQYNSQRYSSISNDLLVLASIESGNLEIVPYYRDDNEEIFNLAIEKGFRITEKLLENHFHLCFIKQYFIKAIDEENFDLLKYYNGEDQEEIYILALEKGFEITPEVIGGGNNFYYRSNLLENDNFYIKAIEKGNTKIALSYRGNNKAVYKLALEKGLKITPEVIKNKEHLQKVDFLFFDAIKKNNLEVVPYYRGKSYLIYNMAIEKGFRITKEMLEKHSHLREVECLFAKSLEEGKVDIFSYYSNSNMNLLKTAINDYGFVITEELLIRNQYIGYDIDLIGHIADINKDWLKYMNTSNEEIFTGVIDHILSKEEQDYLNKFSQYNLIKQYLNTDLLPDIRGSLLSMIDVPFLTSFSENTSLQLERLLKTSLFSDEISELSKIIKNGKLNDFYVVYNGLRKYFVGEFEEKIFLNIVKNYNKYPNFCRKACEIDLSDKQQAGLRFLFNNKQFIDIDNFDDLAKAEEKLKEKMIKKINDPDIILEELKDSLCQYLCNYSMEEIKKIYERDIRISILEKIIGNTKDESLKESCMTMNIFFTVLSECIFDVNTIDDLRKVGNMFLESSDKVADIRNYFSSLKEIIRTIYEKEANENLLDFNNLPKGAEWKKTKDGIEYLSLEHCSYALYAHVDNSIENLFNLNMKGKPTICLSPITNLGANYYEKGITVVYNFIPPGNFIGSSNRNMGSNSEIKYNDLDFTAVSKHFFQLPIKDSSALSIGHPETLSLRPGLIPCGIAIRGDEPSEEELEAFEKLKEIVPDNHKVHLVKPQKEGTVTTLDEDFNVTDSKLEEVDYSNKNSIIDNLSQLKNELLDMKLEIEEAYNVISMKGRLGGSHDFYECYLRGEEGSFYLKPGIRKNGIQIDLYRCYAMESGYLIQKLVNPESAIPVKTVEAPVGKDGSKVLCSAIKVIPNTTNYDNSTGKLSEKEVSFFMKEFIVDHLLFSYDTKGENFLKDVNGNAYGIDKEQSLKFATSPMFVKEKNGQVEFDTRLTYNFDPNGVGIIYKDIFESYQNGNQDIPDQIFEECQKIATQISQMDDQVYLSNFMNFINSYANDENTKKLLIESILARKNNLVLDYYNFVSSIKSKREALTGGKQL